MADIKTCVDYKELEYPIDFAMRAAGVLNGIYRFVKKNGWKEGYRNEMSVNISICCGVLKLDSYEFFHRYLMPSILNDPDRWDFYDRTKVIRKYWHDSWFNHPFSFVINENFWPKYDQSADMDGIVVFIRTPKNEIQPE